MQENLKWKEIPCGCKAFQLGDEPEVIYVIKTGFEDTYMVVYEDAWEINLGHVDVLTKFQVEKAYNIKL